MTNHNHLALLATNFALRGRDVEIVGNRGAGRTDCLARVQAALVERGWETISIRGEASFKSTPYAALALAGLGSTRDARGMGAGASVNELVEILKRGRAAVLVDDWDDVDEVSRGVVTVASERAQAPVVLTRLRGADTPAAWGASSRPRGLMRITLEPLPTQSSNARSPTR